MDVANVGKWAKNGGNTGSTPLTPRASRTFISVYGEQLSEKKEITIEPAH